MMFKTNCIYCGKEMWTYAKSKDGTLEENYCSKKCENNAKHEKRFVNLRRNI